MKARVYFSHHSTDEIFEELKEVLEWLEDQQIGYRYRRKLAYDAARNYTPYIQFKRLSRDNALMFKLAWGGR